MAWRIEMERSAVQDLRKLDPQVAWRILQFLHDRVATLENPRSIGDPLHGPRFGELWRYRVGDWRILCRIQDDQIILLVLAIGHRREVYK